MAYSEVYGHADHLRRPGPGRLALLSPPLDCWCSACERSRPQRPYRPAAAAHAALGHHHTAIPWLQLWLLIGPGPTRCSRYGDASRWAGELGRLLQDQGRTRHRLGTPAHGWTSCELGARKLLLTNASNWPARTGQRTASTVRSALHCSRSIRKGCSQLHSCLPVPASQGRGRPTGVRHLEDLDAVKLTFTMRRMRCGHQVRFGTVPHRSTYPRCPACRQSAS